MWVSAKQTASGKKDKALEAEGSSQKAKTWLHSHRNTLVCDGKAQTQIFAIDKVEPGSKGKLKKGKAYVQFCVTAAPADGATEGALTLYKTGWVGVK